MHRLFITGSILAAFAGSAAAQRIVMDNGYTIDAADITVSGTTIQEKFTGPDGRDATRAVPAARIRQIDWPMPAELQEAQEAIIQRQYAAAAKKAQAVAEAHRPWKDKPGSWYVPATTLLVEALLRDNKGPEADKLILELRGLALNPAQQVGLKLMEALQQYTKRLVGPAYNEASKLIKSTDDSQMLARIYTLIGDIQYERENYREALESYLQIPVFLGAQASFLPNAELGAAKCMMSLKRLPEASSSFGRIAVRYKGSPQAEEAAKLKIEADKAMGAAPATSK